MSDSDPCAAAGPSPIERQARWRIALGFAIALTVSSVALAQAPVAVDDAFTVPSGLLRFTEAPGVLENDYDSGSEPPAPEDAVASLVSDVSHGVLFFYGDGSFDYTSAVGFVGIDTFSYNFVDSTGTSNTATVTITVVGCEAGVAPTQWACWVEAAYLAKVAELGLSTFLEGFEDDTDWAAVRDGATAASVTVQGVTWTSNHLDNDITTGFGAAHSGAWGVYSLPHGDQTLTLPSDRINDGFVGTVASSDSLLGVGGWVVASQVGSRADLIVTHASGATTTAGFPNHTLSYDHKFFGFIDVAGFTSFELVETDGTVNQPYFIFGDDFSMVVLGADTTPPRVVEIGSLEDTGDGVLAEGEVTDAAITQLAVRYSEAVRDLAGDTDPDDVTNPANYLLFGDGGDGFDTIDCASGVALGDTPIALAVSSYVTGNLPETKLDVNGGVALPVGAYRLLVCGTTSIVDWSGNTLDGDGNGTGGDDFARSFEVIVPVNHPPTASPQSASTPEDTELGITLTGTDPDGDPITYAVATGPSHGVLSGTSPSLTYTPNANYNGPDSFTFTAYDGALTSPAATVSITVSPVNDPPVASPDGYSTDEGGTINTAADLLAGVLANDTDVESNPLTAVLVTPPVQAASFILNADGSFTYTHDGTETLSDGFTYVANDGVASSDPATVTITIGPVNDPPVANSQAVTTDEDTAAAITLTATDAETTSLTFTVVTGPAHGSLSGASPNLSYQPSGDYNGPDSFTFTANDGTVDSNLATVSITVDPVNDAPVADDQTVSTDEDVALPITLTASDVDGAVSSYTVVTGPARGTLSGALPNLSYQPAGDYNGPDSFTFTANDGAADSDLATVSITVDPINDAPVANPDSYSTDEGGTIDTVVDLLPGVLANDSDTEDDAITAILVTGPAHAVSFTLNADGSFIYTHDGSEAVADGFSYNAHDGLLDSNVTTVSITIGAVNDAPVAVDDSATAAEGGTVSVLDGGALSVLDNDTDAENDPLTATLVTPPAHAASFTLNADGTFSYTHDGTETLSDGFTYVANDGLVDSDPATVTITIGPVNDPPVANSQAVTTDEDTAAAITLTATDAESTTLSYTVVTGPAHGSLSGVLPNLSYQPADDYNGPDSFTFTANDGTVDSNLATVSITVDPVNDAPVADDQTVSTDEDVALPITLTASDVDGAVSSYTVVTGPAHGTLSGALPNLSYQPAGDYNGPDSFTFTANDGTVDSNLATVSITVDPINDAPVANPDSYSTDEGGTIDTVVDLLPSVLANDSDTEDDAVTAILVTGPAHAVSFTLNSDGSFFYTHDGSEAVADGFSYKAHDGLLDSNVTTVSITIGAINDAPVAVDDSATAAEGGTVSVLDGGALSVLDNDTDAESDPLTATLVTPPAHAASFTLNADGTFSYTHDGTETLSDGFTYVANDGLVDSDPATVTITIGPVNDPPVANGQAVSTKEDTSASITLTASDPDSTALTFTVVTPPAHGTLSGNAPGVTYHPADDYSGPDSFTFTVNDGAVDSSPATVSVTVTAVNDRPVADDQAVSTDEDVALPITLTASDVDSTVLTYTVVTGPAHGTLSGPPPDLSYQPTADYNGPDSFTFTANDGALESSHGTVSITVNPVSTPPTVSIDDVSVLEGDSGTTDAIFTVSLSETWTDTVSVSFATADHSASAGDDYVAMSGVVTFPAGTTTESVTVAVSGDLVPEDDEAFAIDLTSPVNATLGDAQGIVTILNDDPWTWYVALTGHDGNDCTSLLTACLTIGEAVFRATSGDTVMVAAGTFAEHLVISESLELVGEGAGQTVIDGGDTGVVVTIESPAVVTITGVGIRNGSEGGLRNAGDLTIVDSWVRLNGDGTAATFGGVLNEGTARIERCTVSDNLGDTDGGIGNYGQLEVVNSTVWGNDASVAPGINNPATAVLTLTQSTVAANGTYGIRGSGAATLKASLLALHTLGNCDGSVTTLGHNLEDGDTCAFDLGAGDIIATDAMLGPLADNGGTTPTGALLPGSAAIDSGPATGCLGVDQRNMPRPVDGDGNGLAVCDIGAFELQSGTLFSDGFESGTTSSWSAVAP